MIRPAIVLTAACAATSPAWAQAQAAASKLSLYGIIDSGIEYAQTSRGSDKSHVTGLVSGSNAASRFGFDMTEGLGAGLYAGARLETGFEADTGAATSASKYFNRGSYVKVGSSAWGELRLGRDYTPAFYVLQQADVNGLNLYGNAGTFAQLGANGFTRTDNAINYASPVIANTVIRATYSLGDERAAPPKDAGRVAAVSAIFDNKAVVLGGFYQVRKDTWPANSGRSASTKFYGLAGRWNGPDYSLGVGASKWDPAGIPTLTIGAFTSFWLGGSYKFGSSEVKAQVGRLQRDAFGSAQPRATLFGASYLYALSRRTTLYATYGKLDNNEAASFRLEASSRQVSLPVANGADTRAITVGVTHRF